MATVSVGIREFRDNLASYVLESESPLAITRHGDTVGFYFPIRHRRTEAEIAAFSAAAAKVDAMLQAKDIPEEEIFRDIDEVLAASRG